MLYLFALLLLLLPPPSLATDKTCPSKHNALVVSLQGQLFYQSGQGQPPEWHEARLNDEICEGSKVKLDTYSRATIKFSNEIYVKLHPDTIVVLKDIGIGESTWLTGLKGFLHIISRTPKRLTVETPIANAGPEGTEFAISADENETSVWVYEGGVRLYNTKGEIKLKPGESAQALLNQAPQARIDIKPEDAVNWALYYPPVLPYPTAFDKFNDNNLFAAINAFRRGKTAEALSRLETIPRLTKTGLQTRAAMRLTIGQTSLAEQDIRELLQQNPKDSQALALKSVLAITQNRKDEAYALANQAVAADSQSPAAYSALSYAEQGRFQLENALKATGKAVDLAPHDALVWARKAELQQALGLTNASQDAAKQAIALDANLERTQTVLGFAYLTQMNTGQAVDVFTKAVALDSTSPLARLGLGLTKIRQGELEAGRQDLEIAAMLDPNNSLVRSYLGKSYYEERRNEKAEDQFNLAKARDPKDPTPYFYDAINKQTTNRPVEALHDMQKAIELNDNRAIYRSKLMLDEDTATRTANLTRIYNDLGFGRVALKEAWKSLNHDSTNPTAHRFLSDAYIGQPRYRAARASELLQAQLLQPINITPVQPQLTGENIGILNSTGPGSLSLNEYDPLYNANGAHMVLNGAYGSRNTLTDNAIISGVYNNLSSSIGQFHYQTDGFRKNDGYQQDIYDVFAQYAFTPDFSAQIKLKSEDVRAGDLPYRLNGFNRNKFTQTIEQDTARTGGHLRLDAHQDMIASYFYTTLKEVTHDIGDTPRDIERCLGICIDDIEKKTTSNQAELQHIFNTDNFSLTTGGGYINQTGQSLLRHGVQIPDSPEPPFSDPPKHEQIKSDFFNGYVYLNGKIWHNLTSIVGLSFDSFESVSFDRQQLNPKFGLIWNSQKNLIFRGAVFRTLKKPLVSNQTIEPTQLAGFNQFYDEFDGTTAWEYAFGVDYNVKNYWYFGGEVIWRDGREPIATKSSPANNFQWRKDLNALAYLNWVPTQWIAFKAEYRFDRNNREFIATDSSNAESPGKLTTHQVPLSINLFHPSGLFGKLAGIYVNQLGVEGVDNIGTISSHESFWTFDATLGYRFPKKFGVLSFEMRNIFDNNFRFQSAYDASGPQITPFVPERQLFVKLSLFY